MNSTEDVNINEIIFEPTSDAIRMSASEFVDNYCWGSSMDYMYCWTNRTGTSYVNRKVNSMNAYASPYRGTIRHRLKGGGDVIRDFVVNENWISHIYYDSPWIRRTAESKVFEADGDGYHHSVFGHD